MTAAKGLGLVLLFGLHAAVASSYHHSCQRTLWHATMFSHSPFCELHRRSLGWMEVGASAVALDLTARQLFSLTALLGLRLPPLWGHGGLDIRAVGSRDLWHQAGRGSGDAQTAPAPQP